MTLKEEITEIVRALRFDVGTDEMTDEMIADKVIEHLIQSKQGV